MLLRVLEGLVVVVAVLVAGIGFAGRFWSDPATGFYRRVAEVTGTGADLGPVDFARLVRRSVANDALVCPDAACPQAKADASAPVFPVPADMLMHKLQTVVDSEPRTRMLSRAPDASASTARFVEYSASFYFPDVIDALVVPVGADKSTLALYSRSTVGYGDGGVNKARLQRWLATLQRITDHS